MDGYHTVSRNFIFTEFRDGTGSKYCKYGIYVGKADYDSAFRVGRDSIVKIENNAGNYGQSVITNAVNQNSATHWETNRPNNNFHNMITVTLDQAYEISRLRYQVRQDGGKPKGFPLEYNIYYSAGESGEDFQLLKHGTYESVSASEIEIQIEPTQMQRVRFEFVKAYNNWASAAELSFIGKSGHV